MLREATDRALRHTLRPWLDDGWTIADLLWALDHEPDGRSRGYTQGVRCVPAWVRYRLSAWRGCLAPSAAHAAARARAAAEQQRQREAWALAATEAVPSTESAAYTAARAALARRPRRKDAA